MLTERSFSGYHDGRFANRPTVLASYTLYLERHTGEYHHFSSRNKLGLWALARCGALIVGTNTKYVNVLARLHGDEPLYCNWVG